MPIRINGTTVTTNSINGTSISIEAVNETQVYGATANKVWVLIYVDSSQPQTDLGYIESSSTQSYWANEISLQWPPNNYAVGTTACIGDSYSIFHVYQIQWR